jgi:hypothetical protein
MSFVNAASIMSVISAYRIVWISGKFGGHKTALAFEIARSYLEKGYRLLTNSRCVWADDFTGLELNDKNQLKAVVVIDEGGLYFDNTRQIKQMAAYAAKMDVVYIFPSFFPPPTIAQVVNIQTVVSLKATGLPVIIYKWVIRLGQFKEQGWFFWWDPSSIYGIYSRQDPGELPDKLRDYLVRQSEEYRKRYGRDDQGKNILSNLEVQDETDQIFEAAQIISASNYDLAEELGKSRRTKRRL